MKIDIIETRENSLLKRKEIIGIIEHDGMPTPTKAAVQAFLAREKKVKPQHVEIKKIFSGVGAPRSKVLAYIWKEKEVPILEEKSKKEKSQEEKEQKTEEKSENDSKEKTGEKEEKPEDKK